MSEYSSQAAFAEIRRLASRYSFVNLETIGYSVMGKPIYSLSIGNNTKEVFYNGTHHANEWITTPLLLRFINDYASAYEKGGNVYGIPAALLYSIAKLYIVPLVNPDGLDLVTGELSSGGFYNAAVDISERYPSIAFPNGWKANIAGVDLNLQYPAGWEEAKRIKYAQGYTSPAPRDFVGYGAVSAPESRAIYRYTLEHNFKLILAYHTQGRVIYRRYRDYNPPYSKEIGELMSKESGYSLEQTPSYSDNAGYKDWFIQDYNLPGYTIEAGLGDNPLPYYQLDSIYRANLPILTLGITESR